MSKQQPARTDSRRAQLRAAQIAEAKRARNRNIAIGVIVGVAVLVLLIGGGLAVWQLNRSQADTRPPNATAQNDGIMVNPGKGVQGAPVVELYLDYQCPACARFETQFGPSLDALAQSGEIQLSYHTMTFLDTNLGNNASNRAANAAACADEVGRYSAYHNVVFANQPTGEGAGYTDEQLTTAFPQQAGISGDVLNEFQQCYDERRFNGFVREVDANAGRAGVTGTPTLRVNGTDLDMNTLTTPDSLRTEIMKLS